ncbi:MAG: UDP-N-acetylmuramate dehydrogenase [Patescibacteria group bacterium]|nr:UDP-N-acetylmuramate dehydrogenase [Patescibacteria group bacterium]
MRIEENVLLSTLTTFRTGGPARFLLLLDTADDVPRAVAFAEEKHLPLVPLGGGSNMLAPDKGVDAVFARFANGALARTDGEDAYLYSADAGVSWDALVARAVEDGAWGIENLSAIPGTAGAAAVQNIGAYGAAFSDVAEHIEAYDTRTHAFVTLSAKECRFGYRSSVFKEERDRFFITRVALRLPRAPQPNLSYKDLAKRFAGVSSPTLRDIRESIVAIRAAKFPPLDTYGTAGSFFLNPTVSASDVPALRERYPELPLFDLPEGGVKVPLAWFLDRVLELKGMRKEKAFLWDAQPLVVAAEEGARAADVRALAEATIALVKEKIGITVTPEVRILS